MTDISYPACALPYMSWVIPDGSWSDHPGLNNGVANGGPSWVAAIVDAIGESNGHKYPNCGYWENTVILIYEHHRRRFSERRRPHGRALFGSTEGCGQSNCGTIFELTASGRQVQESLPYVFTNPADGATPQGALAFDSAGNVYGATGYGGAICGCGVVFELTPGSSGTWQYQIIHDFDDQDGALPQYGVISHGGHLFGTTLGGGQYGVGVVFEISAPPDAAK